MSRQWRAGRGCMPGGWGLHPPRCPFLRPPSRPTPQEVLARARRRGLRVNLRPLADMRTLAWIPIVWMLLYHGLRFVVWLVVAIASGPPQGPYSGGQRQYQPPPQQY